MFCFANAPTPMVHLGAKETDYPASKDTGIPQDASTSELAWIELTADGDGIGFSELTSSSPGKSPAGIMVIVLV